MRIKVSFPKTRLLETWAAQGIREASRLTCAVHERVHRVRRRRRTLQHLALA